MRRSANFLRFWWGEHFTPKPHRCRKFAPGNKQRSERQDIRLCIIHKAAKATKVCLNPGQNEWLPPKDDTPSAGAKG